jgi:hypothetical protein
MVHHFKIKQISYPGLNMMQSWITKFNYFTAISADQMIMLTMTYGFFVLGKARTELVLSYQIAFKQKVQRIVNSSPAHPILSVFHIDVKFFYIKMLMSVINFIEYSESFRCFSVALAFEKIFKNLLYLIEYFWTTHLLLLVNCNW